MMAAVATGSGVSLRKTVTTKPAGGAAGPPTPAAAAPAAPFLRMQETKEALERNRLKLQYAFCTEYLML
jgi:hypothetical protein